MQTHIPHITQWFMILWHAALLWHGDKGTECICSLSGTFPPTTYWHTQAAEGCTVHHHRNTGKLYPFRLYPSSILVGYNTNMANFILYNMWKAARQKNNMSEFEVFMKKYPDDVLWIWSTLYYPMRTQNRSPHICKWQGTTTHPNVIGHITMALW